jgi:hypothetical protein
MTQLYEHLGKGSPTTQALTQSKRTYLQNHSGINLHPFYWGSHEIWGWSMNKLKLAWYEKYARTTGTAFVLIMIAIFWRFTKRETSRT